MKRRTFIKNASIIAVGVSVAPIQGIAEIYKSNPPEQLSWVGQPLQPEEITEVLNKMMDEICRSAQIPRRLLCGEESGTIIMGENAMRMLNE